MRARRGDTFFTHGSGGLSRLIRMATRDPKEAKTWANHSGGIVSDGYVVPMFDYTDPAAKAIEALGKVEKNAWFHRHKHEDGYSIAVFRHRTATPEMLNRRCRYLETHVGDSYGWWKLGFHLADRVLFKGKKRLSSLLRLEDSPICSFLEAKSWSLIGIDFGMPAEAADPDEMMDWCEAHPETWEHIGTATIGG